MKFQKLIPLSAPPTAPRCRPTRRACSTSQASQTPTGFALADTATPKFARAYDRPRVFDGPKILRRKFNCMQLPVPYRTPRTVPCPSPPPQEDPHTHAMGRPPWRGRTSVHRGRKVCCVGSGRVSASPDSNYRKRAPPISGKPTSFGYVHIYFGIFVICNTGTGTVLGQRGQDLERRGGGRCH